MTGRRARGVAEIYLVETPTGENRILALALRITPDEFARSPRLRATVDALLAFDHPHSTRLLRAVVEKDLLGLEYAIYDADSVRTRLREGPWFTEAQAREWVRQIRDACGAAHAVGLFHGNLDAKHVILTKGGSAKVVGIGEAQIREYDPEDPTAPLSSRFSAESDMAALDQLAAQMMRKAIRGSGGQRSDLS